MTCHEDSILEPYCKMLLQDFAPFLKSCLLGYKRLFGICECVEKGLIDEVILSLADLKVLLDFFSDRHILDIIEVERIIQVGYQSADNLIGFFGGYSKGFHYGAVAEKYGKRIDFLGLGDQFVQLCGVKEPVRFDQFFIFLSPFLFQICNN